MYSVTKHAATAMGEALRQEVAERGVRVTLIEPGMTDTPFFDDGVPEWSLTSEDIARAVVYALEQPPHVTVAEMLVRPTGQLV
jgi:NADP-dependent 3-hydroxy acid dehydrogenase YdfG